MKIGFLILGVIICELNEYYIFYIILKFNVYVLVISLLSFFDLELGFYVFYVSS